MPCVELRERNGMKHIISDVEEIAFAWASYYARNKKIFINGEDFFIEYIYHSIIPFDDGTFLPCGDYYSYKGNNKTLFLRQDDARELRKQSEVTKHLYCFNDETFH